MAALKRLVFNQYKGPKYVSYPGPGCGGDGMSRFLDLVEISIKIGILTIPLKGIYHIFKGKESSLCVP